MIRRNYVPDRGDFVWINLNPVQGHEQQGRRPAIVLSPSAYNQKTGMCLLCPATTHAKGYAFEVPHTTPDGIRGVILADHIRCVDWRVRNIELIYRVPSEVLDHVVARLDALIINPDA